MLLYHALYSQPAHSRRRILPSQGFLLLQIPELFLMQLLPPVPLIFPMQLPTAIHIAENEARQKNYGRRINGWLYDQMEEDGVFD